MVAQNNKYRYYTSYDKYTSKFMINTKVKARGKYIDGEIFVAGRGVTISFTK